MRIYPERPDAQATDRERLGGQSAVIGAWEAAVTGSRVDAARERVVVAVSQRNASPKAASYLTSLEWRLQTSDGQVVDQTFSIAVTDR